MQYKLLSPHALQFQIDAFVIYDYYQALWLLQNQTLQFPKCYSVLIDYCFNILIFHKWVNCINKALKGCFLIETKETKMNLLYAKSTLKKKALQDPKIGSNWRMKSTWEQTVQIDQNSTQMIMVLHHPFLIVGPLFHFGMYENVCPSWKVNNLKSSCFQNHPHKYLWLYYKWVRIMGKNGNNA